MELVAVEGSIIYQLKLYTYQESPRSKQDNKITL